MNSHLTNASTRARIDDLHRYAERRRLTRAVREQQEPTPSRGLSRPRLRARTLSTRAA